MLKGADKQERGSRLIQVVENQKRQWEVQIYLQSYLMKLAKEQEYLVRILWEARWCHDWRRVSRASRPEAKCCAFGQKGHLKKKYLYQGGDKKSYSKRVDAGKPQGNQSMERAGSGGQLFCLWGTRTCN